MMNAPSKCIVSLMIIVFFGALVISPVLAAGGRIDTQKDEHDDDSHFSEESYSHFAHEGYDDVHKCKCPVPNSFTEISDLTIDSSLIEATPHWFLLATGKTEQKVLLEYIKRADISNQKRSTWTRFMMKVWMKYPVKYIKIGDSAKLIPGKNTNKFSLTPKENATFQEIELYIAEDMEKSSVNIVAERSDIILPQWAQTEHSSYTSIACQKEKIPGDLAKIMTDTAPDPDNWYNYPGGVFIHSREHGYVPTPPFPNGIGNAPYRCGEYGVLATTNFQSHHYETAFTNLGYSSHFMEDLGNPYHTPQIQIILLQYIDDPSFYKYFVIGTEIINYKELHDNYEGFVNKFWSDSTLPLSTDPNKNTFYEIADSVTDYAAITDPVNSAKKLAEESWNMNPGLFWDCYWHFAKTGMYNFETNPVIVSKTINRVIQTERYTRGLVHYVTNGKPLMVRIAASAGTGGTITPPGTVSVTYGTSEYYSITANPGYVIDDITVDGNSLGGANQKSFSTTVQAVLSDHTISAIFKPVVGSKTEWIWSQDGWGDWEHTASWSGTEVGPNSEYGPVMVNGHGEHGTNTNLRRGSTEASVWRTFSDPSGTGWNTLTFNGLLPRSDVPSGRWMKIEVNGQQVFAATELNTPPDQWSEPFEIRVPFPQTATVTVKFSHGQNPAWGPIFMMEYDSLQFSLETGTQMTALNAPLVIPQEEVIVANMTDSNAA